MIIRNAYQTLLQWKKKPKHKPLLLRGARQVGKTSLVREFAKEFECFVELNLERERNNNLFKVDDVNDILNAAFLFANKVPVEGSTLLFIDEIQESPKAIQMLRYFYEERPDIYVIAAGSLLEFALKEVPSFPVGRIEYLYLHPLNFQEFLGGIKQNQALKAMNEVPLPTYAHASLLDLFNSFAIIGGMPEITADYIENKNLPVLHKSYNTIWQTYKDDVEKYGKNNTIKNVIRYVIEKAPYEQDRIKFANFGGSNYRSREVSEAMHSLDLAKIIRLVYPTTACKPPALPDLKKSPRLQFLDTGLLNHILQLQGEMIPLKDLNDFHRGKIIQHLVIQELISINSSTSQVPYFWVREAKGANSEVDIVYQHKQLLIPIEIKSGKSGTLRSLHQFIEKTNHCYAVRLYAGEYSVEKTKTPGGKPYLLMNLPYFLGTKIPEYLSHFVETYDMD
jgi:predicted AAA+ superfamily ATPase